MDTPQINENFCKKCNKYFKVAYNYNLHMRQKHNNDLCTEKRLCPYKKCLTKANTRRKFSFVRNLRAHLMKDHNLKGKNLDRTVKNAEIVFEPADALTKCSVLMFKMKPKGKSLQ